MLNQGRMQICELDCISTKTEGCKNMKNDELKSYSIHLEYKHTSSVHDCRYLAWIELE